MTMFARYGGMSEMAPIHQWARENPENPLYWFIGAVLVVGLIWGAIADKG